MIARGYQRRMHSCVQHLPPPERPRQCLDRILRLTQLAPEIVEAIVDGRQSAEMQLDDLLETFPLDWERQSNALARGVSTHSV